MSGPPEAQVFRACPGLGCFLLCYPGGRLGSSRGSTQVDLYGMVLVLGLAFRNGVVYQRGYADRRCVQIAITEVGHGERN